MLSLHTGGAFPFTIGRIEHGYSVRPDLCAVNNKVNPRDYLGRIYTDSLVHDAGALQLLVDVMGKVSENLMAFSDYHVCEKYICLLTVIC